MTSLKKIAIFQTDLLVGGIQKSLLNFLNRFGGKDYLIDVYLFNEEKFYDVAKLPENIRFIHLKPFNYFNRLVYFDILRRFKKYDIKEQYDIAIDFNSYSNECAIGALCAKANKRIIWIHNDVRIKMSEEPKYRLLFHFFKGKFKYFDAFAAVSDGIIEPFSLETGIEKERIFTVNNFIDTDEIFRKSEERIDFTVDSSKYNLASMGRLCHQKGFDLLLNKFKDVIATRKDMHLYIIGDGPDRESLERQTKENGLTDFVTFLGNQKNPFPYLNQMDGFVLDSRYEGQGIVIWEAKALGLEIFIPKHLEKYNKNIEGYEDLTSAIINAKKRVKQRDPLIEYNDDIMKSLEALFN